MRAGRKTPQDDEWSKPRTDMTIKTDRTDMQTIGQILRFAQDEGGVVIYN